MPAMPAVLLVTLAFAAVPRDFHSCQPCVAAGFGWSVIKEKCGGFANKVCQTDVASPPELASDPALVALDFDGEGMLGLSFRKGETPPTIKRVTRGSWAARRAELGPGMQLYSVGSVKIAGTGSYEFVIALLRSHLATCSREQPLQLSFTRPVSTTGVSAGDEGPRLEPHGRPGTSFNDAKHPAATPATKQGKLLQNEAATKSQSIAISADGSDHWWLKSIFRVGVALVIIYTTIVLAIWYIIWASKQATVDSANDGLADDFDDEWDESFRCAQQSS